MFENVLTKEGVTFKDLEEIAFKIACEIANEMLKNMLKEDNPMNDVPKPHIDPYIADYYRPSELKRLFDIVKEVRQALTRQKMKIEFNKRYIFKDKYVQQTKDYVCVKENGELIKPNHFKKIFIQ